MADEIASRWLQVNEKEFAITGQMLEKYTVVEPGKPAGGGEYPLQYGLVGQLLQ